MPELNCTLPTLLISMCAQGKANSVNAESRGGQGGILGRRMAAEGTGTGPRPRMESDRSPICIQLQNKRGLPLPFPPLAEVCFPQETVEGLVFA